MSAARTAGALAILASIALGGCAAPGGGASPGYVSGDGTVTEFAYADRGEPLELTGESFGGDTVDVGALRGQVVIITTWYAACPPCRAEAPDLVALDARADVQVLGVNSRDDAGTAQAFQRTFAVQFPSIDDADGQAIAALQGLVALNAVPTTLILDTEGRVAARVIGRADAATLAALVDAASAEAP